MGSSTYSSPSRPTSHVKETYFDDSARTAGPGGIGGDENLLNHPYFNGVKNLDDLHVILNDVLDSDSSKGIVKGKKIPMTKKWMKNSFSLWTKGNTWSGKFAKDIGKYSGSSSQGGTSGGGVGGFFGAFGEAIEKGEHEEFINKQSIFDHAQKQHLISTAGEVSSLSDGEHNLSDLTTAQRIGVFTIYSITKSMEESIFTNRGIEIVGDDKEIMEEAKKTFLDLEVRELRDEEIEDINNFLDVGDNE